LCDTKEVLFSKQEDFIKIGKYIYVRRAAMKRLNQLLKPFISLILFAVMLLMVGCGPRVENYNEFLDIKYDKAVSYFTKKLELNDTQHALLVKASDRLKALELEFYGSPTIREEMYTELRKDHIDKTRLNNVIKEKVAAFDNISTTIVDELAAFQASLSPEQREKFVAILEKFDRKTRYHRWRIGL